MKADVKTKVLAALRAYTGPIGAGELVDINEHDQVCFCLAGIMLLAIGFEPEPETQTLRRGEQAVSEFVTDEEFLEFFGDTNNGRLFYQGKLIAVEDLNDDYGVTPKHLADLIEEQWQVTE